MSGLDIGNSSISLTGKAVWNDPYLHPLSMPLTDWGTVSYSFTTGFFITNSGALSANANYRYVKIPVQSYWQAVRASGTINIASPNHWVVFLNDANQPTGTYLPGTGGSQSLSSTGNGVLPWPLPAGTTQIGFNSRTTDTALVIQAQTRRVMVIGDSTSISGSTGIGDELAALSPTRTFYQQGIGGQQWMGHIRYRLGINRAAITITGDAIPTSGTAACTISPGILVHTATDVVTQIRLNGVRCALRFIFLSGTYTIEALDTIANPVLVSAGTTFQVITGSVFGVGGDVNTCPRLNDMLTGSLWIVRSPPSINDRFSINYTTMQAAFDDLKAWATRYGARLCVVGMMNGEKDLPTGTYAGGLATSASQSAGFLNYVSTMNTYMEANAPLFVDAQANHIANGGSTVENINGTNFDVLTNQAVNVVLSDYRHETAAAQTSTANLVKAALDPLGW